MEDWENYDLYSTTAVDTSDTLPGDAAYGWQYFTDGTAISPTGDYFYGGEKVYSATDPTSLSGLLAAAAQKLPEQALSAVTSALFKPDGGVNAAGVGTLVSAVYGLTGGNEVQTGGYNRPVPVSTLVRDRIDYNDPNRRPGEGGRQYFTDARYASDQDGLAAAKAASTEQATGIRAAYTPAPTPTAAQAAPMTPAWERPQSTFRQSTGVQPTQPMQLPQAHRPDQLSAHGGIAMAGGGAVPQFKGPLQSGGFVVPGDVVRHADPAGGAHKERGLAALNRGLGAQAIRGPGDAMSDSIPTTIDGKQPAAVANGEAYVPPEKVAQLGGGSMKRGSERLYEMMDNLRMQRTGSTKQINPDNPQQLQQAYQNGGAVRRFNTGGGIATSGASTGFGTSTASTLSPWAGDYVTNALSQGAAAADAPFQVYQGPLTAGPSNLQQQAFSGIQSLANTGYTPTQFSGGTFGGNEAAQYMNPYLQNVLDPQLKEMNRQSQIARMEDASRLTKAGAYGGSRQAIMESEGRRNLLDQQANVIGQGYKTAFDTAAGLYDRDRTAGMAADKSTEESRQFSANYGLKSLADMAQLGQVERGITGEGIAADKAAFEEQRDRPMQMAQYKLDLLNGLPTGGNTSTPNTTGLASLQQQLSSLGGTYKALEGLFNGNATPTTGTTGTTGGTNA